jgi:hypothetical protein
MITNKIKILKHFILTKIKNNHINKYSAILFYKNHKISRKILFGLNSLCRFFEFN